jgi:hypothetical protein
LEIQKFHFLLHRLICKSIIDYGSLSTEHPSLVLICGDRRHRRRRVTRHRRHVTRRRRHVTRRR